MWVALPHGLGTREYKDPNWVQTFIFMCSLASHAMNCSSPSISLFCYDMKFIGTKNPNKAFSLEGFFQRYFDYSSEKLMQEQPTFTLPSVEDSDSPHPHQNFTFTFLKVTFLQDMTCHLTGMPWCVSEDGWCVPTAVLSCLLWRNNHSDPMTIFNVFVS